MEIQTIYDKYTKVLIIGPCPPPLGGISVFIYRLSLLLNSHKTHIDVFNTSLQYKVFGFKYLSLVFKILFNKYQVIHIQNLDLKKFLLLLLLRSPKKFNIFFTDHNSSLFEHHNKLIVYLRKKFLNKVDTLMPVNHHILENYRLHNVTLPDNYFVCNAFLPPPIIEKEKILKTYPNNLIEFLESQNPLFLANAFQLRFIKNIDLYGLDMCVELTKSLKNRFPKIGFIFCLANNDIHTSYLKKIQTIIEEYNLIDNFYFLTGQKEIWPLFEKIDLFIRPTYQDGYGISIDEAIFFNCPVIASDVCIRNTSAILFKNRNINDLYNKSLEILRCKNLNND